MDYIRYHEMEALFMNWPQLEGILQSIRRELIAVNSEFSPSVDEEYITSLCIGSKSFNNMPPSGKINDSTYDVAMNYKKIMKYEKKQICEEIEEEALNISLIIDKLEIAFRRLNNLQQRILKMYYWENKTWQCIANCLKVDNICISKRGIQDLRHEGIEKMIQISRITIETYNKVMKIIGADK